MKKQKLALAFMTMAFITGCSSSDDNENFVVCPVERPISVQVGTRAAVITTSTLQGFYMYGKEQKYKISRNNDGTWNIDYSSWPSNADDDEEVTFYAYNTDTSDSYNSNDNYITHIVAEDAFTQKDLLYAQQTTSYNATGGTGLVSLTFDHACAALAISLEMTNTLKNIIGDDNITVTKVMLKNVKDRGHFYLSTKEWTEDATSTANYTLTNSEIVISSAATKHFMPCEHLFLIPQDLSASTIEVTYRIGSKEEKTKITNLAQQLTANKKDTINVKIGTSYNY